MVSEARRLLEATPGVVLALVGADGSVSTYSQKGVADLFYLLNIEPARLRGASVADKVIGKGAAALMALGGVKEVWAGVISRPALELLEQAGIPVSFGTLTEGIINRMGTGPCPVESLCASARTPEQCLPLITDFIEQNKKLQK